MISCLACKGRHRRHTRRSGCRKVGEPEPLQRVVPPRAALALGPPVPRRAHSRNRARVAFEDYIDGDGSGSGSDDGFAGEYVYRRDDGDDHDLSSYEYAGGWGGGRPDDPQMSPTSAAAAPPPPPPDAIQFVKVRVASPLPQHGKGAAAAAAAASSTAPAAAEPSFLRLRFCGAATPALLGEYVFDGSPSNTEAAAACLERAGFVVLRGCVPEALVATLTDDVTNVTRAAAVQAVLASASREPSPCTVPRAPDAGMDALAAAAKPLSLDDRREGPDHRPPKPTVGAEASKRRRLAAAVGFLSTTNQRYVERRALLLLLLVVLRPLPCCCCCCCCC